MKYNFNFSDLHTKYVNKLKKKKIEYTCTIHKSLLLVKRLEVIGN